MDKELIDDLRTEADLCANEGVEELAALLNQAAERVQRLTQAWAKAQA